MVKGCGELKKQILLPIITLIFVLSICGIATASENTTIVSIATNGSVSNDYSYGTSISGDGRYVTFTSYANNLVLADNNGASDIFLRDTISNATERISISSTGEEGNYDSYEPSISADGRYVAFTSYATNLVPGDTNGFSDVFIRDRLLNTTYCLSISNTGEGGNADSYGSSISADGRYIAFVSPANNLVSNDDNGFSDIFVYDQTLNSIKRISISNTGKERNWDCYSPCISADGNCIAFVSGADNLISDDNNSFEDIFVYNQALNSVKRVSISTNGEEANGGCFGPSISADGRYIAFTSYASNLVTDDNNDLSDIFVRDQILEITERVSISSNGEEFDEECSYSSISANGRYITFVVGNRPQSARISLSAFEDMNGYKDIFVHDRMSKITRKVSISSTGEEGNGDSNFPSISADGSFIAFNSYADNLVPEDNNYHTDVFVYTNENVLQYFSGYITPNTVKSGDSIIICVHSSDAINITALIFDTTSNLIKQPDGIWILNYTVPNVPDGNYPVILKATDAEENFKDLLLNLTVDNVLPTIFGTITPNMVKSGDMVTVNAFSDPDTSSIYVSICGENLLMARSSDNIWILDYYIPNLLNGNYPVLLTSIDKARNLNTFLLTFMVDNGAPTISGSLNPENVKSFDKITINITSDPDTSSITALILNNIYNLIKQSDGRWILNYTVPYISDGNYSVLLTAIDPAGNQGTLSLNFKVFNPIDNSPPDVSGTVTHAYQIEEIFIDRPWIYIRAFSDPDTISVTASILNTNYTLTRQEDGSWTEFAFSRIRDAKTYTALLTAMDWSGNQANKTITFNIENIIPRIITSINPNKLRSGDILTLNVSISPDAKRVYANTPSGYVDFEKQSNGLWNLQYTVPQLGDGGYAIRITFIYGWGWFTPDTSTIIIINRNAVFSVDNTPPYLSGFATPSPLRSGDMLKINAIGSTGSYFITEDVASITATFLGQTYLMNKSSSWSDWHAWNSGSNWNMKYIVPKLPDGVYTILFTATDLVGNQKTLSVNFTVDNTPPIMTATISPNILKFIDFGSERRLKITAQSSLDTKSLYVYFDRSFSYHPLNLYDWRGSPIFISGPSSQPLNSINGFWIYEFGAPKIITIGTHYIKLVATDYAGNGGISYIPLTIVDFLGSNTPPSGWSGTGVTGISYSGSSGGSSENTGGGLQGGSSEGSTGSSGSESSSGGSDSGSSGDAGQSQTSPDYTLLLIILLVVILLLALIFLWYIGALSVLWFFLEIIFFAVIRGFIGLIGIIMEGLAYIGWLFLEGIYTIINPFTFIMQLFTFSVAPSIPNAIQLVINVLGGRFNSLAPLAETIEAGLYSYGIFEVVDSIFKLGDKFKKWLKF